MEKPTKKLELRKQTVKDLSCRVRTNVKAGFRIIRPPMPETGLYCIATEEPWCVGDLKM